MYLERNGEKLNCCSLCGSCLAWQCGALGRCRTEPLNLQLLNEIPKELLCQFKLLEPGSCCVRKHGKKEAFNSTIGDPASYSCPQYYSAILLLKKTRLIGWVQKLITYITHILILILIFAESAANMSFYPRVMCHIRSNSILDKCHINIKDVYTSWALPPLGNSDHDAIQLLPTYRPAFKSSKPETKTINVWSSNSIEECIKRKKAALK